jgi:hypothetical protein
MCIVQLILYLYKDTNGRLRARQCPPFMFRSIACGLCRHYRFAQQERFEPCFCSFASGPDIKAWSSSEIEGYLGGLDSGKEA